MPTARSLTTEQIAVANAPIFAELVDYSEFDPREGGTKSRAVYAIKPYDPAVKPDRSGVLRSTIYFEESDFSTKTANISQFLYGIKARLGREYSGTDWTGDAIARRLATWWKLEGRGNFAIWMPASPPKGVEAPAVPADFDPAAWREANVAGGDSVVSSEPTSAQVTEEDLIAIATIVGGRPVSRAVMAVLSAPDFANGKYGVDVIERALAEAVNRGTLRVDDGRYVVTEA